MPEKSEQTDFFPKLEKPADAVIEQPVTETAPRLPLAKKKKETVRMGDNIPTGGKLGGWQSHYDGN